MGTATLSTTNVFGENVPFQPTTTFAKAQNLFDKLLQIGDDLENAVDINRSTDNTQTNSTIVPQCLIFLDTTPDSVISSISSSCFLIPPRVEAAQTYRHPKNIPSMDFSEVSMDRALILLTSLVSNITPWVRTALVQGISMSEYYEVGPERTDTDFLSYYKELMAPLQSHLEERVDINLPPFGKGGDR